MAKSSNQGLNLGSLMPLTLNHWVGSKMQSDQFAVEWGYNALKYQDMIEFLSSFTSKMQTISDLGTNK